MSACPICGYNLTAEYAPGSLRDRDATPYSCENCGTYELSDSVLSIGEMCNQIPSGAQILSHHVRKMQRPRTRLLITYDLVKSILSTQSLPRLPEQLANMILWAGDASTAGPGTELKVGSQTHQAIIGAASGRNVSLVIEALLEDQCLKGPFKAIQSAGACVGLLVLTTRGWGRYEEIMRGALVSRTALMAMKFGDETLDMVLKDHFKPAVEKTGFILRKLDDVPRPGLIDDHLRVELLRSRFVIADLTHDNRGAYWEAGFAEGLGRPVIYTCERSVFHERGTHFDTNHHLTVQWSVDRLSEACAELKALIRVAFPSDAILEG